jgi:Calx-beta domain-containing protein
VALRRIALALLVLALVAPATAHAAFATSDLGGTWFLRALSVSSAPTGTPEWVTGTIVIGTTGAVTGGSILNSSGATHTVTGGAIAMDAAGKITGTVRDSSDAAAGTVRGQMLVSKDVVVLVHSDAPSSLDPSRGLAILVRSTAPTFSTIDLTGSWRMAMLVTPQVPSNFATWSFGLLDIGTAGTVIGGAIGLADGSVDDITGGSLSMAADGNITGSVTSLAGTSAVLGVMIPGNGLIAGVFTQTAEAGVALGMFFLERDPATTSFSPADVAGTWQIHEMHAHADAGNTGSWAEGTIVVNSDGVVTAATFLKPDGTVETALGGAFAIDAGLGQGFVAGGIGLSSSSVAFLGTMSPSKNLAVGVDTSADPTQASLGLWVLSKNSVPTSSLGFSASKYTVSEAGGAVTIGVTRTGSTTSGATVDYVTADLSAFADTDYTARSGTLTFPPGNALQTFSVPVTDNAIADGSRLFTVALSNPTGVGAVSLGAVTTATVTITDDDSGGTVQFATAGTSVPESAGQLSIAVTRTGTRLAGNIVVPFTFTGTAIAGVDYSASPGTLTFAAGQTAATIVVDVLDDALPDGSKILGISLGAPTGGATLGLRKTFTLTIGDNEQSVGFSAASYTVSESVGVATIRVNRTGVLAGAVSVHARTVAGTAVPGRDYTDRPNVLLSFPAGSASQTFTVPITNTTVLDGTRTLTLELFSPTGAGLLLGAPPTATLAITDDDSAGVIVFGGNVSVVEGGTATLSVIRSGTRLVGGVSVAYSVVGGTAPASSYALLGSGVLTFGPGETSKSISLTTVNDTIVTGARTVILGLESSGGGGLVGTPGQATVTITDDDRGGVVQFSTARMSVAESAGLVNVKVTRTGSKLAGSVTVPLTYGGSAVAGTDYGAEPPSSVTFGPGETSRMIPLTILDNTLPDGDRTLVITLGTPSGGATLTSNATLRSATLTIRDDESTLQFSGHWVGNSPEVVRTGAANTTVTVHYRSYGGTATDGADYVHLDGTLTFGPGIMTRLIPLQIINDRIAEGPETFTIVLSAPTGGALLGRDSTLPVTIQDNDFGGVVEFGASTYTASAGATATITVKRTGGLDTSLSVDYATANGTAIAGIDYVSTAGTLTFGVGQATKTFTVTTLSSDSVGSALTVTLTLGVRAGSATLGSNAPATLTISPGVGTGLSGPRS